MGRTTVSFGSLSKMSSNTSIASTSAKSAPGGTRFASPGSYPPCPQNITKAVPCSPSSNPPRSNSLCSKKAKETPREASDLNLIFVSSFFERRQMALLRNLEKLLNIVRDKFEVSWDVMPCWSRAVIWWSAWPLIIGIPVII